MKKYLILLTLILIQGCSSGGDDAAPAVKVDLLGVWNYGFTYQNSICSGLYPQGTLTVEQLGSDTTKIGNLVIDGTTIDLDDFGNCSIIAQNRVDSSWSGRPAEQTLAEYNAYTVADNLGDNTIQSDVIESFTSTKIQEKITYTNGVVQITVLSR